MDSDLEPKVIVQLQTQTTTEHLSDDNFDSKATAAAVRIKKWLPAQLVAQNVQNRMGEDIGTPKSQLRKKLATITEDEAVEYSTPVSQSTKEAVSTVNRPEDKASPVHPGELVSTVPKPTLTHFDNDDAASDVIVRPSLDTVITAVESELSPLASRKLLAQKADGSYEEVDLSEIAPWLYQEDQCTEAYARVPETVCETPPPTLGRANAAGSWLSLTAAQTHGFSPGNKLVCSYSFDVVYCS